MSLKRSFTAPTSSSLSNLTEFPTTSPTIPKRSLPTSAYHRPRANSRATTKTKTSLSRVTSRVHVSQEDPFNCSGFFPGESAAVASSSAEWDWVRNGNDDDDEDAERDGDEANGQSTATQRRPRLSLFILNDHDNESENISPVSETASLPITPAVSSLLSPISSELDDEFTKRIRDEDKMGVLRMTMSASHLFYPARSGSPTPLPSSDTYEAEDLDALHTLISTRRLRLTTSDVNLAQLESKSSQKSTLFSPADDDEDVVGSSGGEKALRTLGGYVVDNVKYLVGL